MSRVIPKTSLWREYVDLREMSQKDRLAEAQRLCESPGDLAAMFVESVAHFAGYDNRGEHFYPSRRTKREPGSKVRRTNDVILRLERQKRLIPEDAYNRRDDHDAGDSVLPVPVSKLACHYIDRELLVHRTTSPAQWEDGSKNRGGLRLDVLLADSTDQTPIVGELKLPGDMDPFFALFQALACAAHLNTAFQYERMRRHLGQEVFPELALPPSIDVWVLFADSSARQKSREGRYTSDLELAVDVLAPRLLAQDAIQASLRRIVAVDLKLTEEASTFVPEVRWAWGRLGDRLRPDAHPVLGAAGLTPPPAQRG